MKPLLCNISDAVLKKLEYVSGSQDRLIIRDPAPELCPSQKLSLLKRIY